MKWECLFKETFFILNFSSGLIAILWDILRCDNIPHSTNKLKSPIVYDVDSNRLDEQFTQNTIWKYED